MRKNPSRRKGATIVEAAIVYPVTFLCTVGFIVGTMGVFRYQEVATLSRETCRYAIVHGTKYASDAGVAAPTPTDIYNNVILPRSVALDPGQLTYSITYNSSNNPFHVKVVNGEIIPVYNTVTVVVTYQWLPEAFFGHGITLSSSSSMQMSY